MAGNKHKNGIVCRFPGCDKTMRTQKFKMHFTKAHLKQGEVYSVEHRRQYEVAREDNSGGGEAAVVGGSILVRHGAMGATNTLSVPAETTTAPPSEEGPRVEVLSAIPPPAAEHKDLQTIQTIQTMQPRHSALDDRAEGGVQQLSSNKRPASAMEATGEPMDPLNALLVEFVAMMDQRFQELVGKMGEMIEVQKHLIDALQNKNPAVLGDQVPALALASAAEAVMKRRKRDDSPPDSNGANNGYVL